MQTYTFDQLPDIRNKILDYSYSSVSKAFPLEDDNFILEVQDLEYEGPQITPNTEKEALLIGGTVHKPLRGTLILRDKRTGKVISQQRKRIAAIPYLTSRGTFIINGNEFGFVNQLRLKPGVYTRLSPTGQYEAQINVRGGIGHKYSLDPETGVFMVRVQQANIPLLPVLNLLGIPDDELVKTWGKEIYVNNFQASAKYPNALKNLYTAFFGKNPPENYKEILKQKLLSLQFDPEVVKITTGVPHEKLTPDLALLITQKLLSASSGQTTLDDRNHLAFTRVYGPEDFIPEVINKNKYILRKIFNSVRARRDVNYFPSGVFDKSILSSVYGTGLGNALQEINPLELLDSRYRVTRLGEGGISSAEQVMLGERLLHPSHLGFIDPLFTPESITVGVDNRFSLDTFRDKEGNLYGKFINTKARREELVPITNLMDKVITFPEEMDNNENFVRAIFNNQHVLVPRRMVDYVVPSTEYMYSPLTNLIPMKQSSYAQRVSMGARMLAQAVPLVDPEAPLVRNLNQKIGKSFDEIYGEKLGALHSPVSGKVVRVRQDTIDIVDDQGNKFEIKYYNTFPFNRKTFYNEVPLVKAGDVVKKGQLLATSNYTDSQGALALGKNLYVAYIPFEGYNFEDAGVISESAAKKMTSEHLYQHWYDLTKDTILGKARYQAIFPGKYNNELYEKYLPEGIPKPGSILQKGEPIALLAQKTIASRPGLKKLFKDISPLWEHEDPAEVVEAVVGPRHINVILRARHPLRVGDKLCYDKYTEVLTGRGWIPISEVELCDKIVTLNPENNTIEYLSPTNIYEYSHSGPLYHVTTGDVDLAVTLEHKLYVRLEGESEYKLVKAEDLLNKVYYMKCTGNWEGTISGDFLTEEILSNILEKRAQGLPNWLFTCKKETLERVFHALRPVTVLHENITILKATTREEAQDYLRLCILLGYSAYIKSIDPSNSSTNHTRYLVYILHTIPEFKVNRDSWKLEYYDDHVYCVTLPRNHVFLVKRAKAPVFSGNSGRFGDKSIISLILPDEQMPKDENGRPFELLLNPLGVQGRVNVSQIWEALLGKIAKEKNIIYNIPDHKYNLAEYVAEELRKAGHKSKDAVYIPGISQPVYAPTGYRYILKLHHMAESKLSGRGTGAYTSEEIPVKGGFEGAKRVGLLEMLGVLTHGAYNVARDARTIRGQRNLDYWTRVSLGYDIPRTVETPLVYEKFLAQLTGLGLYPVKKGGDLHVFALTGSKVNELVNGRFIKVPEAISIKDQELSPVKGGLFDENLTGGLDGTFWSGISLAEPMPNPIAEPVIRTLLGLTQNEFRDILSGKTELPGYGRGPEALRAALAAIDLQKTLQAEKARIPKLAGNNLNATVKRVKYLEALIKNNVSPDDLFWDTVPVLPPVFRPASILAVGNIPVVADSNYLYKDIIELNNNLSDLKKDGIEEPEDRLALYDSIRAVAGFGAPVHPKYRAQRIKGILASVIGDRPKEGIVQRKLLGASVDLVGRATIIPNPNLGIDEVAIPEQSAWEIYKPYIVRRLVRGGMQRLEAAKQVMNKTEKAKEALLAEMRERPVIISRAPVLHKFGIMGAWPRLTKNTVLEIPPFVVGGFGADFDGDTMQFHVPADPLAVKEVIEKMMPSKNLFTLQNFRAHIIPTMEYAGGLYYLSTAKPKGAPIRFKTRQDVLKALLAHKIAPDQLVEVEKDE